jgi:CHASE3 domain sensor protein
MEFGMRLPAAGRESGIKKNAFEIHRENKILKQKRRNAMFKNLKLKYSILLGYTIPLVLIIIAGVIIYANVKKVEEQSKLVETSNRIIENVLHIKSNISSIQRSSRGYILYKNETSLKLYEEGEKLFQAASEALGKMVKDPAQLATLGKIVEKSNKIKEVTREFITLVNEGRQDKAVKLFQTGIMIGVAKELDEMIADFEQKEIEVKNERLKKEEEALSVLVSVLFLGILLTIVISIVFGLWVSSRISRTIVDAVNSASATSTEIAATISQHERTANQQASMVNETTTTLEELSKSSRQSAEQAESSAAMAKKATTLTEEGDAAVRQSLEAMEGLKIKVGAVAEQILSLSEQTGQIGTIVELVKDLAVQINMLALNAAVEAARAGEHGKGFAVVSAEVRKLAVESKKSAEQAKAIVSGIQKATDTTVMKTEEGTKNIEDVAVITQKVGNLFEALSETAGSVYNNAQQVLLNTKQQSLAIGQVVEAANSINAGAKQTAAGISQTKIGIQNLNETTEKLKQIV